MLSDDIKEILVSEEQIESMCKQLGKQLSDDYRNNITPPLVIGLLKGCVPFMTSLIMHMDIHIEMDFMVASSYHGTSSGDVQIKKDLSCSVKDRDIIIVEDIVDTGKTLRTISDILSIRGAKSIVIVTLLDKPERRITDITPKYVGYRIPNEFAVGFGLDYNEKYRNLPFIGVLKEEVYKRGE